MDEFALIAHLTQRLRTPGREVRVGIGDDAAVIGQDSAEEMVVTTDAMVEGVHFLQSTLSWRDVGYKSIAVSISDVAAMGGEPRHVALTLAIPKMQTLASLEELYDGISEVCQEYGCAVIGGDTVSTSGPFLINTTVLGAVPSGQALLRSGAKTGDVVFVTGNVGGSGAGLQTLLDDMGIPPEDAEALRRLHQRPQPQVTAGQILRECGVSACNDISDGLASELNEIAKASQVRLRIEISRIPMAPAVRNFARRRGLDPLDFAWFGGEDYQLVGTANPFAFARALARCESVGIKLSNIGRVEAGDGVVSEDAVGNLDVVLPRGYNHFESERPD